MNILSTRIKNKHDDLSNWINFNPILLEGEIGLVKFPDGTENMKIGNGVSSFLDLPYVIEPFSFEILSGNFPEPIEDNLGKIYLLNRNLVEIENAKKKIMSFDTSEASSYWIEPIFPESETDTYKQKCPYSEGTRRYSTEIDSETGTISAHVDSVEAFLDLEYDINQNDSGLSSLVSSSRPTMKIILDVDELDFDGKIFVPIDFGYHAYFKNASIVGRENRTVLKNITIRTDHSTNYRTSYIWVTPVGIVKYATTLSAYNLEIRNEVIANDRMVSSSGVQTVGFLAGLVSGGNSAGHPYVFDNILFDNCTILGRNYNGLVIGSTYDTDNQVLFSNLSVENSNLICYGIGPDSASQYNRYLGYCRASQDGVSASLDYRNVVYTINKKNGDFSDVGCLGFFTQYILNRNGVTGELEYSQIIDDLYLSSYTKAEIDDIVSSINNSIEDVADLLESAILSIDGLSSGISSLRYDLILSVGNLISNISEISSALSTSISALELSVFELSNSLSSLSTSFVELSGNVYLKDETYNRTEIDGKVKFLSGEISSLESSLISVSNSLSNYVPISGNVNVENSLSISENLFVGGKSLLSIILENSSKVLLREWS